MKSLYLILLLAIVTVSGVNAQKAPWWYNNPPESSTGKYCYISAFVQKGEDVLDIAIPKALSCIGIGYKGYSKAGNGAVKVQTEVGDRTLRFQRVKSQADSYNGEYVLMMFTKEEIKAKKKLPKGPRHLPVSFLLSSVIPGTGQFYKKENGKAWLFLGATVALGGTSYFFETRRMSKLDEYEIAATFEQREQLISEIERNRDIRNYAAMAAGAFYLVNIVDALASNGRRYAYNPDKRVNWNVAYVPVGGGFATAGFSFAMGR